MLVVACRVAAGAPRIAYRQSQFDLFRKDSKKFFQIATSANARWRAI
jgi:hypothetical protein